MDAKRVNNINYYMHSDVLGSITAITNSAGSALSTYEYDPYGIMLSGNTDVLGNFGFTGQEIDFETNLYHFPARYYEPYWGRFITPDPWTGMPDDERNLETQFYHALNKMDPTLLNRYPYVANDPINRTDPKGLFYYKPGVPPAGPPTEANLRCMDFCLHANLGISAGSEPVGHTRGSLHYKWQAADISFRMNPGLKAKDVMCCAKKCGFGFALVEANHYHVQIPPGIGGSRGDLPKCGCDPYTASSLPLPW